MNALVGLRVCSVDPFEWTLLALETRLNYARVLVEVDVYFDYPSSIQLQLYSGVSDNVSVEYEHKIIPCSACKLYGYSESTCNMSTRKEWKWKSTISMFYSPHQ